MGLRGRPKKYWHKLEVAFTTDQWKHVSRIATMADVPQGEVVRHLVQDSLDKANGVYDPLPSTEAITAAFAHVKKED